MEEKLYRIEEFFTTGWEIVEEHLTRSEASRRLESLMNDGISPTRLRATRED
jgi:predicted RNA-binding protein